jgi:hypothetical protein
VSFSLTQFGGGPGDQRRRRLLTEHTATAAGTAAPTSRVTTPPVHKTQRYGDAEFLDHQPSLLDLAPRGLIGWTLVFLAGSAAIAAIEALYIWMPRLTAVLGHRTPAAAGGLAAFDLGGKGSLAAWFSSLVLLAASLVAVLVYSVRRHQVDDYRGHYRVWLWAALCWFLMATDAAASLHEGFRDLMTLLTGAPLLGDGSIWWVIGYALLLGAIGTRLLLDMWPCRLSIAALLLALGSYAAAVAIRLGWLSVEGAARRLLLLQGTAMGGHLLVLLAMGLHLRHVLADARGLLPPRVKKAAKTSTRKPSAADDPWVTVDSPHGSPQPVLRRASAVAATASPAASAPAAPAQKKLSRAERKALRNRLIQERLKRQQQADGAWGG